MERLAAALHWTQCEPHGFAAAQRTGRPLPQVPAEHMENHDPQAQRILAALAAEATDD